MFNAAKTSIAAATLLLSGPAIAQAGTVVSVEPASSKTVISTSFQRAFPSKRALGDDDPSITEETSMLPPIPPSGAVSGPVEIVPALTPHSQGPAGRPVLPTERNLLNGAGFGNPSKRPVIAWPYTYRTISR